MVAPGVPQWPAVTKPPCDREADRAAAAAADVVGVAAADVVRAAGAARWTPRRGPRSRRRRWPSRTRSAAAGSRGQHHDAVGRRRRRTSRARSSGPCSRRLSRASLTASRRSRLCADDLGPGARLRDRAASDASVVATVSSALFPLTRAPAKLVPRGFSSRRRGGGAVLARYPGLGRVRVEPEVAFQGGQQAGREAVGGDGRGGGSRRACGRHSGQSREGERAHGHRGGCGGEHASAELGVLHVTLLVQGGVSRAGGGLVRTKELPHRSRARTGHRRSHSPPPPALWGPPAPGGACGTARPARRRGGLPARRLGGFPARRRPSRRCSPSRTPG